MGRNMPQQRQQRPQQRPQQRRAPAPAAESKWSDPERARFCAKLGDLGLQYDAVAEYCESINRPRPSLMGEQRRQQLLAYLEGAADVVAGLQGAD